MTADLLFKLNAAHDAALLFGEQDAQQTDATVEITGAFPSLSGQIEFDQSPTLTIAGQFPQLAGSILAIKGRELAITAQFPQLAGSLSAIKGREITIEGQFPQLAGSMRVARNYNADVLGQFPQMTGSAFVVEVAAITIQGSFPVMVSAQVDYNPQVARPTVSHAQGAWQIGTATSSGMEIKAQEATKMPVGWATAIEAGLPHVQWFEHRLPGVFVSSRDNFEMWAQDGTDLGTTITSRMQGADRQVRLSDATRFQDASPVRHSTKQRFQDGGRGSRAWRKVQHQDATRHKGRMHTGSPKSGTPFSFARNTRFQDGRVPPPGISKIIVPVVPPVKVSADLLFFDMWPVTTDLLFGKNVIVLPTGVVVVQQRRIYIMINNATLRRVEGNISLPVLSMSLSLDVDSWTWGFTASLPGNTLANLEPSTYGAPVEVEASINGEVYRALVEGISRSREFGKSDIRVSGRGKTALLDAPYSPVMTFGNLLNDRTAQQLVVDVLTLNGVGMGWDVNWGLTDWLVPTGVFTHQGTYVSAINEIAQAAGGYMQPDAANQTINILPRYPTLPWDWGTTDIDYELPSDVTTRESIDWQERARYNRVYVSGVQQGVIGQVTRNGTAGDLLAPMATHPLITHYDAARQRGGAILANTGRIANVGLRLPVLAETGVIKPGKMVRYVDGGDTRIGIVRSVAVEVGFPEIWQNIGVETHVN